MRPGVHIINKQLFEFECEQKEHAFSIQQKMSYEVQDRIAKAIDRVCCELADNEVNYQIPLLEIDLGEISFDRLEEEIVPAFEKAFYEKLSGIATLESAKGFVKVPKQESSLAVAKTFLLTGRLPWYVGKPGSNLLADLFSVLFAENREALKRLILSNLSSQRFIERLASQVDDDHLNDIIDLLEINPELLLFIEKSVFELIDQDLKDDRIQVRRIALEFTLKLISVEFKFTAVEEFIEQIKKLLDGKGMLSERIQEQKALHAIQTPEQMLQLFKKETVRVEEFKRIHSDNMQKEDEPVEASKFYISNAGLVLIANFLPLFFNELQLLENGAFTSKQNQVRAVFLLNYLCTAVETVPEYILPLNKILCGLGLEEPLPSMIALNEREKNECHDLIGEIIRNWQKLGNTSVDAFRDSFLNRDGILSFENNGWKLQVERKGYDILLESLPWSFVLIKLGWMDEIITTEW